VTVSEAKKIGSRQGLLSVGLGLLIAQATMTYFNYPYSGLVQAFFWFTSVGYWLNVLIGVVIMLACGHYYGQLAGNLILIKKWNFLLIGFLSGISVIMTTSFFASWTGFIQEGIDNVGTYDDPFYDYIFKPMYWITLIGLIPSIIVGIWFGWRIRLKGKKTAHNNG
jgi:hypothetical protein